MMHSRMQMIKEGLATSFFLRILSDIWHYNYYFLKAGNHISLSPKNSGALFYCVYV
jgi:hypothetical protein